MRAFCRCCLFAGKVGGAVTVVLGVYLAVTHGLSLAPWDLAWCSAEVAAAREKDGELEVIRHRVGVRLVGKTVVADDLRAGRLGLLEAAARFRDLNDADPSFEEGLFRKYAPGATDEERLCRSVIGFVANPPRGSPDPEELVRRLEAEVEARLADGTLRLREPRPPFTGWASAPPPSPAGGDPSPGPRPAAAARSE
jgi:hypothetical protein